MMKDKSIFFVFFFFLLALFMGCSKEEESKKWDFNEYIGQLLKDSLHIKYKGISLWNATRDPEDKTSYTFYYKDSITIYIKLNPDYSYKMGRFQRLIDTSGVKSWVDDVPEHAKKMLDSLIQDCKRLQLVGISGSRKNYNPSMGFLLKNLNLNSVPVDIESNPWISDTVEAYLRYSPVEKPVYEDEDNYIYIKIDDRWRVEIDKPGSILENFNFK